MSTTITSISLTLLGLVLSSCSSLSPIRTDSVAAMPPRVDGAVVEALSATGRARVLITLRDVPASQGAAPEREAAVAAAQDAVLARLPSKEFTLLRRYRSVPGLAASITPRALEVLRADPRVSSIDLDETGGAHPDDAPRAR